MLWCILVDIAYKGNKQFMLKVMDFKKQSSFSVWFCSTVVLFYSVIAWDLFILVSIWEDIGTAWLLACFFFFFFIIRSSRWLNWFRCSYHTTFLSVPAAWHLLTGSYWTANMAEAWLLTSRLQPLEQNPVSISEIISGHFYESTTSRHLIIPLFIFLGSHCSWSKR